MEVIAEVLTFVVWGIQKLVYKLLIDTYRLRLEDDYNFTGDVPMDSIYDGGASDGRKGFLAFLKKAERREGSLPNWWTPAKASACLILGLTDQWWNLGSAVEKSDIIEQYGDPLMPMQLRMFGEQVYGNAPWGQPAEPMLKMQMDQEAGTSDGHFRTIDNTKPF
ncbi:MYND domain protein [Penicillium angulare]|uniref:MYND domain protein n=1 Tax=Penicillium angulare TaxID=116970 RepID=A0A9W9ETS9_9EURO|nr:MYND domain protein [Penicillium angulare]